MGAAALYGCLLVLLSVCTTTTVNVDGHLTIDKSSAVEKPKMIKLNERSEQLLSFPLTERSRFEVRVPSLDVDLLLLLNLTSHNPSSSSTAARLNVSGSFCALDTSSSNEALLFASIRGDRCFLLTCPLIKLQVRMVRC